MSPRMKTIKVSNEEYDWIQRARQELQRKGYERIEDRFANGEEIDIGEILAGLALGAIAAAGAIAIVKLLAGRD